MRKRIINTFVSAPSIRTLIPFLHLLLATCNTNSKSEKRSVHIPGRIQVAWYFACRTPDMAGSSPGPQRFEIHICLVCSICQQLPGYELLEPYSQRFVHSSRLRAPHPSERIHPQLEKPRLQRAYVFCTMDKSHTHVHNFHRERASVLTSITSASLLSFPSSDLLFVDTPAGTSPALTSSGCGTSCARAACAMTVSSGCVASSGVTGRHPHSPPQTSDAGRRRWCKLYHW